MLDILNESKDNLTQGAECGAQEQTDIFLMNKSFYLFYSKQQLFHIVFNAVPLEMGWGHNSKFFRRFFKHFHSC